MRGVTIRDVYITNEYVDAFDSAPSRVRKKMSKDIDIIAEYGVVPNGWHTHQSTTGLWVGRVTMRQGAWRVLFEYADGIITLVTLLRHDDMDIYLRELCSL